jgi:hypothetical protein
MASASLIALRAVGSRGGRSVERRLGFRRSAWLSCPGGRPAQFALRSDWRHSTQDMDAAAPVAGEVPALFGGSDRQTKVGVGPSSASLIAESARRCRVTRTVQLSWRNRTMHRPARTARRRHERQCPPPGVESAGCNATGFPQSVCPQVRDGIDHGPIDCSILDRPRSHPRRRCLGIADTNVQWSCRADCCELTGATGGRPPSRCTRHNCWRTA